MDGRGKWSFWALTKYAKTAIVSFSSAPLRIITLIGFGTLLFGCVVVVEALVSKYHGLAVSGYTSMIITLLFLGSAIMISLGIIGEYIANIYDELKNRPSYLVKERVTTEKEER